MGCGTSKKQPLSPVLPPASLPDSNSNVPPSKPPKLSSNNDYETGDSKQCDSKEKNGEGGGNSFSPTVNASKNRKTAHMLQNEIENKETQVSGEGGGDKIKHTTTQRAGISE